MNLFIFSLRELILFWKEVFQYVKLPLEILALVPLGARAQNATIKLSPFP